MSFAGQAWSLLAASQLRFWARAADAWSRLVPDVLQSVVTPSGPEGADERRAALVDALRAGIGEMVQMQIAEARRFETELTDLARRVWPPKSAESADEFKRRWTVKE